jgi:hypothetical protein
VTIEKTVMGNNGMRLSVPQARVAIVAFSLGITGVLLCFLILAPTIGIPFNPGRNENLMLVQIVIPVFLGYLGSASHFVFRSRAAPEVGIADESLLGLLVYGSFGLYVLANVSLFTAFFLNNRSEGVGMSIDELSKWFTLILGVLTCTVSVITSYIFSTTKPQAASRKAANVK